MCPVVRLRAALSVAVLALSVGPLPAQPPAADLLRFDFESGDTQGWQVVEGSFGHLISGRERFHNTNRPYNKQGRWFLTTLETPQDTPNDGYTGAVASPVFRLTGPEISLLVGGGGHAETYVALCTADGREVVRAGGKMDEDLQPVRWQVPQLVGQLVFLRVVDHHTGGWGHITCDDVTAHGVIDRAASETNFARERRRWALGSADAVDLAALRAAIADLQTTFGAEYPRGAEYLARLDALARAGDGDEQLEQRQALARAALLDNPLLRRQPILFVVRHQYRPDHHNTETLFQVGEVNTGSYQGGGALKALDVAQGGQVRTLLTQTDGVIRDPDVSFDGRRIVFAMRRHGRENYHLFEIGADGSGLRQLTSAAAVTDIDPCYLPDGEVVFSSSREPKYCMCNRHIMANLFRMAADGANIHQIGRSTLFEGHSSLLPDGRVLYDRWEYVDRNFGDAQGLWSCNPDGTNHRIVYGNNTPSPGGVIDARAVPGTSQIMAVLGSCHDRPWGALGLLDPRRAVDGRAAVLRTWPATAATLVRDPGTANNAWDTFLPVKPKFEDPYPLSDKYFLCSRMTGQGEQMGLYLVDVFGNQTLLHVEGPGCFDPLPLAARPRPAVIAPQGDPAVPDGRFYVRDVYQGTHLQGVARGTVKWLRVVESPEKRHWTGPAWNGQGQEAPAMNWHDFNNKRILGTVPVEADGSAYFAVPADRFVYFQLLDEQGQMVQSMRSGTIARPGERNGCVGCHDDRLQTPPASTTTPAALRRAPSPLQPWYGEPRLFSFADEVQPVLTRRCLTCHDFGGQGAKAVVLAPDRDAAFSTAYTELWRKRLIKAVGAGPAEIQPAGSWGARASRLVQVLRGGHQQVRLSPEELDRLVTWIDLNAPYYPTYASAYPDGTYGRGPLNAAQRERLKQLGVWKDDNDPGAVNLDRPELSRGLAVFAGREAPGYQEALAILRAGQAALAARPRGDSLTGFAPCETDRRREERYRRREACERRSRDAIRAGTKVYDEP